MSNLQNLQNQSYIDRYYAEACEFTVPVKLNTPIWIEPQVLIAPVPCTSQKLPIQLEPEITLKPEVQAALPHCNAQPTPIPNCPCDETEPCEPVDLPADFAVPYNSSKPVFFICFIVLMLLCLTGVIQQMVV